MLIPHILFCEYLILYEIRNGHQHFNLQWTKKLGARITAQRRHAHRKDAYRYLPIQILVHRIIAHKDICAVGKIHTDTVLLAS